MRTSLKRRSLVRQAELELELAEALEAVERALRRAGLELDRWQADVLVELGRELLGCDA